MANKRPAEFSQDVLKEAFWLVLYIDLVQRGILERFSGFEEVGNGDTSDIVPRDQSAIAAGVKTAQQYISGKARKEQYATTQKTAVTISRARYDEIRDLLVENCGPLRAPTEVEADSVSRVYMWPPTAQTLMKRLGGGYWNGVLAAAGLQTVARGRARGRGSYTDAEYRQAIILFMRECSRANREPSYSAYTAWLRKEETARRNWPSPAAMRVKYGSWNRAKEEGSAYR